MYIQPNYFNYCDNCNYNSAHMYNPKLTICSECSNYNSKVLISQGRTLRGYPITKTELRKIRYIIKDKSYYFLNKDLETFGIHKYGSKDDYQKAIDTKLNRKQARLDATDKLRLTRKSELDNHLKSIGLPGIREDTYECINYITNGEKAGLTINEIGISMIEIEFFHKHTNYKNILSKIESRYQCILCTPDNYNIWTLKNEHEAVKKVQRKALKEYVIQNHHDIRKCIQQVPRSLISKFDELYEKVKNNNLYPTYHYNDLSTESVVHNINPKLEFYNDHIVAAVNYKDREFVDNDAIYPVCIFCKLLYSTNAPQANLCYIWGSIDDMTDMDDNIVYACDKCYKHYIMTTGYKKHIWFKDVGKYNVD